MSDPQAWFKPTLNRVTMEAHGRPDLFFTYRDLAQSTYGTSKRIEKLQKGFDQENPDPESVRVILDTLIGTIEDWHMTDPLTGEAMPKPKTEADLDAFPLPSEFFGLLLTGKYTLVECFYLTKRYNFWRMILLGDPLYNPFKSNPQLRTDQVPMSTYNRSQLTHP